MNGSRPDPSKQAHMAATARAASNAARLTTNDALEYLKAVKDIFQDNREKYSEFLEVMKDFKSQRIDTTGVIARVKQLFEGHRDLILGFNTFLPKGFEIKLPEEKKPVEFQEAISFVNKIKNRFEDDERVYKSFLDILNMYRKQKKSMQDVYKEVEILFQHHADLFDEFAHFLPRPSGEIGQHALAGRAVMRQERGSGTTPTVPSMRHLNMEKNERAYRSHAERDLSVDRPDPHDRHRRRFEKENDRKQERDRRDHGWDEKDFEHDSRGYDNGHHKRTKPSRRAGDSVAENLGTDSISGSSFADKTAIKSEYMEEFIFCEKVKEKVSPETYQEFLKCLDIYSKEIIRRTELKTLVSELLGKYPDLVAGFNEFLSKCEDIDGFLADVIYKREIIRSVKTEDRERERVQERDERDYKERERGAASGHKVPLFPKEKYNLCKPISELDLSNSQRCTPSYRLLPKHYSMPPASHMTELGASVLNDDWVSVTSGSEDYSFKHMRKNQYEESLFRCEDDRFELDMLLESVSSTADKVEELIEETMQNKINTDGPIRIEDYFSPLNLRCIEKLYGDHGLDAMDILRKNATHALPVILTRLKQKQEEWSRCRSDFNKVWADIYAKNYHKSLDHRSFYFKQQDAKNLTTKALVAEIKELSEKKQQEDDAVLALSALNRQPIIPTMEFEYKDPEVHEDLYQIIKYSCRHVSGSSDQVDKVIWVLTTFLEPILGVAPRHLGSEEDAANTKNHTVKSGAASTGQANGSLGTDGGVDDINPEQPSSLKIITNEDTTVVENGLEARTDAPTSDRTSEPLVDASSIVARVEQMHITKNLESTSVENITATEASQSQTAAVVAAVVETHVNNEVLPSEGGNNTLPASASNKIEREEGELSPNADFEEDNLIPYGDDAVNTGPEVKEGSAGKNYQVTQEEAAGEDDATVGEQNTQKSTEDSGNVSEAGEDISGSESADVEECSREDNEEEEEFDHDAKVESEGEAAGIVDAHDVEGEMASLSFSEQFLHNVKPLAKLVNSSLYRKKDSDSRIFYGNDSFYVLYRLHQTLYERILSAKTNSKAAESKWRSSKDIGQPDLYAKFMSALYSLLDGSADSTKFEDDCRSIIGTQSYILFTLDKLIFKLVKQLQSVATDDLEYKLLQLYNYENSRNPERSFESVYHENARVLLHDESIYRFVGFSNPNRMSIQQMDYGNDRPEVTAVAIDPTFTGYLQNELFTSVSDDKDTNGIFMKRNKRKFGTDEICKAMEGTLILNGLECRISCNSSKASYVLDTEDCLYRTRKRGCYSEDPRKRERFHTFLEKA